MRIVMFSMTPLFRDRSMGGAQKQLKKIALHLAEQGHDVTILCTQRSDAMQAFRWHERLEVVPIYRFKQPFPEPYATPAYNIAGAIQDTGEYLARADRFYSHDGGLIFPYIYQDIPAVISLRSILFSETLQSGFLFQGDALILPSEHTAAGYIHTVGRFFPEFASRVHVIHNGLDWDVYRPAPYDQLAQRLGVDPEKQKILLYPHRPEEPKGIRRVIRVVEMLVYRYGLQNLRVLVPRWIDTGLSAEVAAYYRQLEADIRDAALYEQFIFHDWISDDDMPAYFSLGHVTVALGNYVETFGNTPYESLACGTPVVAARVGPYRGMLPEEHVDLVDYGDDAVAAERIAIILSEHREISENTMRWLHTNFSQADMVAAYADVILNASKLGPMPYLHRALNDASFVLAPWCVVQENSIYHDFRGDYSNQPELATRLAVNPDGLKMSDGVDLVLNAYRDGYLVPVWGNDA